MAVEYLQENSRQGSENRDSGEIELGIFVDSHLQKQFKSNNDLIFYVKTYVDGARQKFQYPSLGSKIFLTVNYFEIMTKSFSIKDFGEFQTGFSNYAFEKSKSSKVKWDLNMLLTG